ncbi:MAG TPA: long-chain fatty acid--CoA ligase [Gemmatimonadota bacterium]|nr:long-chain fatty acid--CoA ligase [Gemmatimonadota bacterium]
MSEPTELRIAGKLLDSPGGNLAQMFLEAVERYHKPDALRRKVSGAWRSISHAEVYADVKNLALGLKALGIAAGDRIAILSENRPEWLISDFACVMAQTVSVPLYPVLPAEQIAYMLQDSEARAVLVSTAEQLAKVRELRGRVPSLEQVILFDSLPAGQSGTHSFAEVLALGEARAAGTSDEEYRSPALATAPDDMLTILYTSGTTGRPKGVMLTHNNLYSNVRAALESIDIGPHDVSLSVLPLSHVFERMVGHYTMFGGGATIAYAESFEAVGSNFVEVRPTLMSLVPRGYEKIYSQVEAVAREGGATKQKLLRWSIDVGSRWVNTKLAGEKPAAWLALQRAVADRLVFSKLRARTGGRMRLFISGGAPLNPDLARFFLSAGLTIIEGYGLTETSPVIALNRPDRIRIGTVGQPLSGVEVAIATDGEILTRGPHVMKGYYKDPEATAAAIDRDGWFHTGDIGELDREGYLSITDRKKDLIVTAGGKNIAPQPIENRVANNPYVSQVVMIGDRRRFPILIIAPEFSALESWARAQGITFESREQLVRDPQVVDFMEREILAGLADLARYERPKKIALLPRELSIDMGEITPTLKVRRRVIEQKYSELIDPLYKE